MQRERDGMVLRGKALADLDGSVKAISECAHQAVPHFIRADQVHQLVSASEVGPDMGFMARLMALCVRPVRVNVRLQMPAMCRP